MIHFTNSLIKIPLLLDQDTDLPAYVCTEEELLTFNLIRAYYPIIRLNWQEEEYKRYLCPCVCVCVHE